MNIKDLEEMRTVIGHRYTDPPFIKFLFLLDITLFILMAIVVTNSDPNTTKSLEGVMFVIVLFVACLVLSIATRIREKNNYVDREMAQYIKQVELEEENT